jgi:hypothetical protein
VDHTARGTGTTGHLKLHLQGQLIEYLTGTDVQVQTLTPLLLMMTSKIYCNHTQNVCQPLRLLQIRKPESNVTLESHETNSVVLVRKRTRLTERPPFICEFSANFSG